MLWRQPYTDRTTDPRQRDDLVPVATSRLAAIRPVLPVVQLDWRGTPDGAMHLPGLALRTAPGYVISRSRAKVTSQPLSYGVGPQTSGIATDARGGQESVRQRFLGWEAKSLVLPLTSRGFDGFAEQHGAVQRHLGSLIAPPAIAAHRPTLTSVLGSIQPKAVAYPIQSQGAVATPALTPPPIGSNPLASPPLLHHFAAPIERGAPTSAVVMREGAHTLPLASPPWIERQNGSPWPSAGESGIIQASPQVPGSAMPGPRPISGEHETEVLQTETGASPSQVDLDELVEMAFQKLMRKLTIEQERRGYTR